MYYMIVFTVARDINFIDLKPFVAYLLISVLWVEPILLHQIVLHETWLVSYRVIQ